jgi:hypothetical protein
MTIIMLLDASYLPDLALSRARDIPLDDERYVGC